MNSNLNALVDIKKEYTQQLITMLSPCIYDGIKSIYDDGLNLNKNKNNVITFQKLLEQIPKWNTSIIEQEVNRIKSTCNCDWLPDLINAILISNIRILSNNSKNISNLVNNINISPNTFIHNCYIEASKKIINNSYLFYTDLKPYELQINRRDTYTIINKAIEETIRKSLPFNNILKQYLTNNSFDESDNNSVNDYNINSRKTNLGNFVKMHINSDLFNMLQQGGEYSTNSSHNSTNLQNGGLHSNKQDGGVHSHRDDDRLQDGGRQQDVDRQQDGGRHSYRDDDRQQDGGRHSHRDDRQQDGGRHSHRDDRQQDGGRHSHRDDDRQQDGGRHSHRDDRQQDGGRHSHRDDDRQQDGVRHSHRDDDRNQDGGRHSDRDDDRNQDGGRHSDRDDDRQNNEKIIKNNDSFNNKKQSKSRINYNEISETYLINKKNNVPEFDLIEDINENDIKQQNKNINIAEVYSTHIIPNSNN